MCGNYGCKNCTYHKVWYSNDYWSPDEHECIIPDDRLQTPDFDFDEDDVDDIYERCWGKGEEWNISEEQICPYYKEYIPRPEDF